MHQMPRQRRGGPGPEPCRHPANAARTDLRRHHHRNHENPGGQPDGRAEAPPRRIHGRPALWEARHWRMRARCRTGAQPGTALPDPSKGPAWNGWGVDAHNTRFQSAEGAGLTVAQVPNLKLKWAFGFPLGVSAFGQPSVASGRVFVGSDIGYVYSLDMHTGCVHWSYQAKAAVRTAHHDRTHGRSELVPVRGLLRRHAGKRLCGGRGFRRSAVDQARGRSFRRSHYRGSHALRRPDLRAHLHLRRLLRIHPRLPVLHVSRKRVRSGRRDGRPIWKTYTIPESKPTRKNSIGTQLWAPSGVAVWNSPTVDAKRRAHLFRNGRFRHGACAGYIGLHHGCGSRHGKGALGVSGGAERCNARRVWRKKQERSVPGASWSRLGLWSIAHFDDAFPAAAIFCWRPTRAASSLPWIRIARVPWFGRRTWPRERGHAVQISFGAARPISGISTLAWRAARSPRFNSQPARSFGPRAWQSPEVVSRTWRPAARFQVRSSSAGRMASSMRSHPQTAMSYGASIRLRNSRR